MADSTSESRKVVPLFTSATSGKLDRKPPGGGGGDFGPRIEKLESDVLSIKTAINTINKNLVIIEKRTRYFNRSVSHKELLGWAGAFLVIICAAYAYVTPLILSANNNETLNAINESLSDLKDEARTNRSPD